MPSSTHINIMKKTQVFDFLEIQNQHLIYLKEVSSRQASTMETQNNISQPIIIDYGSNSFKAGWANSSQPDVVVRSIINRTKDVKQALIVQRDADIFKGNYQSPYEKNLIYHQGAFEHLNDHIFSQLRAGGDNSIGHPIICTEPCANPKIIRQTMVEMMFECYGAPSLMLGVDALFGGLSNDRLIISLGDQTCHIIPVLNAQVKYENIKRINVGGHHSLLVLYRGLLNRHSHLRSQLSFGLIEKIHRSLTVCAPNYSDQLKYFKEGSNCFTKFGYKDRVSYQNTSTIDGLYDPVVVSFEALKQSTLMMVDENDVKRRQEIKMKKAERLIEALNKKKAEKNQAMTEQLQQYEQLLDKVKTDPVAAKIEIESLDAKNVEELKKRVKILKVKLGLLPKEALDEDKYQYIDIPDSQLTPQQLNQKRYQIMMKQSAVTKALRKSEEQKRKGEARKFKDEQPHLYLDLLYERRSKLIKKIDERKKRIAEMNTRNSRFNQRRMQTLAILGAEQKEDNFGVKDEDWDLYRGINKDLDSDEENAEIKLQEVELELRELDIDFDDRVAQTKANVHQLGMELYEITLSVDRVKCNEVYFQPSIVGNDQCGLIDAIMLSIRQFSQAEQQRLLGNVYLTGGAAGTKGLATRIKSDLQSEIDASMNIQITVAEDPVFDSWLGMQRFYQRDPKQLPLYSISKEDYFERGSQYFKLHQYSNYVE